MLKLNIQEEAIMKYLFDVFQTKRKLNRDELTK